MTKLTETQKFLRKHSKRVWNVFDKLSKWVADPSANAPKLYTKSTPTKYIIKVVTAEDSPDIPLLVNETFPIIIADLETLNKVEEVYARVIEVSPVTPEQKTYDMFVELKRLYRCI